MSLRFKFICFPFFLSFFLLFLLPLSTSVFSEDEHDHEQEQAYDIDTIAIGQSATENAKRLEEIRKQISETQKLLNETLQKKSTLQNEIAYQDNQIKLTQLKVQQTESEIEELTGQINKLENVLVGLSEVFSERAVETYKLKRIGDPWTILLSANNVNEFISNFHYLQRVQQNDRELLLQMQSTQTNYEDQRAEVKTLHDELESHKNTLARQKAQKENLLRVTQSDEKKYQELLVALRTDADSIARALASLGAKIGPVKKGDIIASVGNTGCSTGPHLHFGTYENAKVETDGNGRSYVTGNLANPHKYLDNGQLSLPLPNSQVNWDFGQIYYIFSSSGTAHTGIDYGYRDRSTAGQPIYAAGDGIAYLAQDSKTCALTGTVGKGIIIDHQNGLVSLYWHLP